MTHARIQTANARKGGLRLLARLLLSLIATILALAAVEIGLRILGLPRFLKSHSEPTRFVFTNLKTAYGPFYVNAPGRITFRYDGNPRGYFDARSEVHHDVNASGFRGPAFTSKPPGTCRLVFLGDSFTFGEGVRDEDTYPEVTALRLLKQGYRVEPCNLGVGGYNTTQEEDALRLFGFDLKPDVVVLGYTLNDAEPPLFQVDPATGQPVRRPRENHIEAEAAPVKPPDKGLYHLHLAQMFWQFQRQRHLTSQTIHYYQSLYAPSSAGRMESERALRAIISQCHDRGIPCIVVMFPLIYELSDDYPFTAIHNEIGKVVTEAGGYFIDLLPALKGKSPRALIVHPTDQHPNEITHAIAGKLVAEEILKMPNSPLRKESSP